MDNSPDAGVTIAIVTPAGRGTRHGNRVTALRWAGLLRQSGAHPFLTMQWHGRPADAMFAVHARRSADSIRAFSDRRPGGGIAVLLAGTDVYPEFDPDPTMRESLELADVLIVLQPEAIEVLPAHLRSRAVTAVQSSTSERGDAPEYHPGTALRACLLAHLRAVKDPLAAFGAADLVRRDVPLEITVAGSAIEPALAELVQARSTDRCRWVGELPRKEALELLSQSHLLLLPSRGEGGANVLSEAIARAVPILASAIPGNTGILSHDWPGLFDPGDTHGLAALLERFADDARFRQLLRARTRALQPLVAPERERQALVEVLRRLGLRPRQ